MSHSVGAYERYASPRSRLRRNARWATAIESDEIVVYSLDQSTDRPSRRHRSSNACSSIWVSSSHSSMKFCRLIGTCFFGSGLAGGVKSGSYGSDGSQRTP